MHGTRRHDGHRPGLVLARDSAHADGHPARRAFRLIRHDGHPAQRACGLVRHTGIPHDERSDSSGTTGIPHDERSDSSGPCPAWASWIAGFPALRYPCVVIGARRSRSGMGVMDRRFSRASIPMKGDRCALVRVRHGRHGSPVFPRSATHAW